MIRSPNQKQTRKPTTRAVLATGRCCVASPRRDCLPWLSRSRLGKRKNADDQLTASPEASAAVFMAADQPRPLAWAKRQRNRDELGNEVWQPMEAIKPQNEFSSPRVFNENPPRGHPPRPNRQHSYRSVTKKVRNLRAITWTKSSPFISAGQRCPRVYSSVVSTPVTLRVSRDHFSMGTSSHILVAERDIAGNRGSLPFLAFDSLFDTQRQPADGEHFGNRVREDAASLSRGSVQIRPHETSNEFS